MRGVRFPAAVHRAADGRVRYVPRVSSVADALVGLALPGVPVLALVSCVLLVVTRQPRAVRWGAVVLGVVLLAALATYAVLWGRTFDALDAGRPVSSGLERAQDVLLVVGAATVLGLLALLCARVLAERRADGRGQRSW
ncbi:hypothetical protein GCM10027596_17410 [Nocardioides korecus]